MNIYRGFASAVGAVALNAALAQILAHGAAAATPQRTEPAPQVKIAVRGSAAPHWTHERCFPRLRTRTIIAVALSLIV